MVDSCDIEGALRRILNELMHMESYKVLQEVLTEIESESTAFKKHQKMLEGKRKQIEQVKQVLPGIQQQAQVIAEHLKSKKFEAKVKTGEQAETFEELPFIKKLMDYRLKSRRNYYEHLQTEIQENIQCYERDTRIQAHADIQIISFWLLKYDTSSDNLDMLLRQMFDNWSSKRRDFEIVKKFRRFNLKRIQELKKLVAEREDCIEEYRRQKEIEQKKREEELRKLLSAIVKIQAAWRGIMVRKHLGPYKIKKPTKAKGKKGKGKKKK